MKISEYYSQKIKVISFFAVVFVIYIHSPYLEAKKYIVSNSIQLLFTDFGLAVFAVPIFYFISGFLFFHGVSKISECFPKIKRRITTLLIPYIIWNIIFFSWYILLAIIPGISSFDNGDVLSNVSLSDPIGTFLFFFIKPVGFHLWFLRDLILFVVLSPMLYVLIRNWPILTLILTFLLFGWLPRFGLLFFVLGGVISVTSSFERLSELLQSPISQICLLAYLLNAGITVLFGAMPGNVFWQYYIQIIQLFSIVAIWGLYDILFRNRYQIPTKVAKCLPYTFFVYLFHEPTFNIVKKIGLKIGEESDFYLSFLFLINPIIIILISISVGLILKKYFPKVYSICVGGR